ncbi:hypothetical protein FVEN_g8049, partial [Fusarium venenatum]
MKPLGPQDSGSESGLTGTEAAGAQQSAGLRSTASVAVTANTASAPRRLPVNPRRHKVAPEHRKRVATA